MRPTAEALRRRVRAVDRTAVALAVIVLLGAAARCWNLDWDQGAYTFHPDEWAINEVVRRLGPDGNPHFFFYGSLPIYLDRLTAALLGWLTSTDWLAPARLALIGRAYSALASTAMLPLVFLIGRRLWGARAGLLAAACTAGAPLLIQAAHFGTVDSAVTLAGLVLCRLALRIAAGAGLRWYAVAGVVLGLAVATKLTALSFVLFPALAWVIAGRTGSMRGRIWAGPLLAAGTAALTTLATAPYYLLAWPELVAAVREQTAELGGGDLVYTWQFRGSTPYLFEAQTLVGWSLGPPLALAALAGWVWVLAGAVRRRGGWLLVVLWPTLYALYIGTWEARFVRHTLPLIPFCCLFAAGGICTLAARGAGSGPGRILRAGLPGALVAASSAAGIAILAVYSAPDTRLAATAWITAQVPAGATIVIENRNTLVPVPAAGQQALPYHLAVLDVTGPDGPAKRHDFATALVRGDLLIVPNRRWAGVLPRLPAFPDTGRYYRMLAGGDLGYTPAATFASPPRLGPWAWPDDAAEETFQVFDHPTVQIYRNTGHLAAPVLEALLAGP